MFRITRLVSVVLFGTGIALVLAGVNAAIGFSVAGLVASVAAIVALLYAGAVWFGVPAVSSLASASPEAVLVFDRSLRVAAGAHRGTPVAACFPGSSRAEIEARCAAVLDGAIAHFSCRQGNERLHLDAVPIRSADGTILYGALLTVSAAPSADQTAGV